MGGLERMKRICKKVLVLIVGFFPVVALGAFVVTCYSLNSLAQWIDMRFTAFASWLDDWADAP